MLLIHVLALALAVILSHPTADADPCSGSDCYTKRSHSSWLAIQLAKAASSRAISVLMEEALGVCGRMSAACFSICQRANTLLH